MTITPEQILQGILQALPWLVVLAMVVVGSLEKRQFIAGFVQIVVLALRGAPGATASQPAPPPGVVPVPIPPPVPVPIPPAPIPPPKPIPAPPVVVPVPPVVPAPIPAPPIPAKPTGPVGLSRQNWPHDPAELDAFYGDPRGAGGGPNPAWEAANLVSFTFPWHEKGAQSYKIHKKCLASLDRILNAIWDHAGHDQAKITAAHLDETGGTYAFRANRNNPAALSNHSRGIAIDLAPDSNPNRKAWVEDGTMLPRWVIQIFKAEGWRWGGDFNTTKDAMHFEAVFDQHHDQPPVPAPVAGPGPLVPVEPVHPLVSGASVTGKMSWFGGPDDKGVAADEGLALAEPNEVGKFPAGLFLPEQPAGTTGLARRLNPAAHYIAMRWDYKTTPRSSLQGVRLTVSAAKTGKSFDDVIPIDWGPNVRTGRVADLSHGLMTDLGIDTDDVVTITVPVA